MTRHVSDAKYANEKVEKEWNKLLIMEFVDCELESREN